MRPETGLFKLVSIMLTPLLLSAQAPASRAQSVSGSQIAEAVAAQLPARSSVVLLPVTNSRLDLSGDLAPLLEETAAELRARGFAARTLGESAVEGTALRTIGRAGVVEGASIGRFATALGVGLILLLALSQARQSEMSVTASIYSGRGGVFDEIWKSKVGWREQSRASVAATPGVASCTRNLLVNGDFERDWPDGWKRSYGDIEKGGSVTEVVRGSDSNVLHMKHSGLSDVSLYQLVRVPKGRIFFQFEVKFSTREGPIMGFSGTGTAGLSIILFDANRNELGMLWAGNYVHNPFEGTGLVGVPHGPRDTNSASFIETPNGRTVRERFDVSRFVLDRLGKVDLDRVEYVAINISVGATDNNAGAEAWVDNLSLEVCPS
jgi:hypothetical protein